VIDKYVCFNLPKRGNSNLRWHACNLRWRLLNLRWQHTPFGGSMPISLPLSPLYAIDTEDWPTVAAAQPLAAHDDAITPDNFLENDEGDIFAFEDRNVFTEDWPGRHIFVVLGSDEVLLFDTEGNPINEPEHGVPDGRQPLNGEGGFVEEWRHGYYQTASDGFGNATAEAVAAVGGGDCEAAEAAAALGALAAAPDADGGGVLAVPVRFDDFFAEGKRIRVAAGDAAAVVWHGALLCSPLPADAKDAPGLYIAYDDGDLMEMGSDYARRCHANQLLFPLPADAPGLVSNNSEADRPKALRTTSEAAGKTTPIGIRLGAQPTPSLFGAEHLLYYAHHLRAAGFPAPTRQRRASTDTSQSTQDRQGFHTFRSGDVVSWTKGEPGEEAQVVFGASCTSTEVAAAAPGTTRANTSFSTSSPRTSSLLVAGLHGGACHARKYTSQSSTSTTTRT
jgi:hypothetical protein